MIKADEWRKLIMGNKFEQNEQDGVNLSNFKI